MKRYINLFQKCILFQNIQSENLLPLLGCLGGKIKNYEKGMSLNKDGICCNVSGIVLTGALQIVQYDYYGNRSILSRIEPSQLFGESYSFLNEPFNADLVAAEDSVVLLFDAIKISTPCQNHCSFHIVLINNLVKILASKNVNLNRKIQCLSKRTTREKLLNYLSAESKKQQSPEFFIPYDRQALADYLCVERSAMSAELSKLRRECVLECKKNKFKFL